MYVSKYNNVRNTQNSVSEEGQKRKSVYSWTVWLAIVIGISREI